MHTAVLTDRERAAVQAYLRLLHTVRAVLDVATGEVGADGGATGGAARCAPIPPALLADADHTLAAAGLTGTDGDFFALLRAWFPSPPR